MRAGIPGVVPLGGTGVPTAAAISGGELPLGCCSETASVLLLTTLVSRIETVAVLALGVMVTPTPAGAAVAETSSDALLSVTWKFVDGTPSVTPAPSGIVSIYSVCTLVPGAKTRVPVVLPLGSTYSAPANAVPFVIV